MQITNIAALQAMEMTCHQSEATQLAAMFAKCPTPLPAACTGYPLVPFTAPTCTTPITIPGFDDDCPIPKNSCPLTACQFTCAAVTNDPPALEGGDAPILPQGMFGAPSAAPAGAGAVAAVSIAPAPADGGPVAAAPADGAAAAAPAGGVAAAASAPADGASAPADGAAAGPTAGAASYTVPVFAAFPPAPSLFVHEVLSASSKTATVTAAPAKLQSTVNLADFAAAPANGPSRGIPHHTGAIRPVIPGADAAASYLTGCAIAATNQPLPNNCTNVYAVLQQSAAVILQNPMVFTASDQAELVAACKNNCVPDLNNVFNAYVTQLPPVNVTPCDAAMESNAVPLFNMVFDFVCLQGDAQDAALCAPVVSNALIQLGVLEQATGRAPLDLSKTSIDDICDALASTGCCGTTFLEMEYAIAQMTCHAESATVIRSIATACSAKMSAPCQGFNIPSYEAAAADCAPVQWPAGCDTPAGTCPQTACQTMCTAALNSVPPDAPGIIGLNSAPEQHMPLAAAAYMTSCFEDNAGTTFTPECASTYEDLQALLAIVRLVPEGFSTNDAAVLQALCQAPNTNVRLSPFQPHISPLISPALRLRCGESPLLRVAYFILLQQQSESSDSPRICPRSSAPQTPSCITQFSFLVNSFVSKIPPRGGTIGSKCDLVLGDAIAPLTASVTSMICLQSGNSTVLCAEALAAAFTEAGLTQLLTSAAQPSMLQGSQAASLCAALAKYDAGCCAGALFNTLGVYYQLTCNQNLADAFLEFAAAGCSAQGPGLSPCPGYLAPEVEAHPAVDCQGLSLPPSSCSSIPKGQCPKDSCEFLWCVFSAARGRCLCFAALVGSTSVCFRSPSLRFFFGRFSSCVLPL